MLIDYLHRFSIIFESKYTERIFDRVADAVAPPYDSKCLKHQLEYYKNIQSAVSYSIIKTINVRLLMQYLAFLLLVYLLFEILLHCKHFIIQ